MGILLGYSEVGYRVLLGGKITIARHVEVIETDTKCIGFEENSLEADRNDSEDNYSLDGTDKEELEDRKDENNSSIESSNTPRRSIRIKKTPVRYPEKENICEIHANYCKADIPRTFEEAICCENNEVWKQTMDKEIECLYKNKTWKFVERVKGKEVLDVKWVYTKKSEDSYKARLVARGFQQRNVADDIYSPVASNQTFKILLSYCCQNGLIIEQMDVETVFLNGEVTSEVYVNQPKGYADGTDRVCKLSKALYGLKESPRDWYECFDKYVTKLGFKKNNIELCLYTYGEGENVVYL